MPFKMTPLPPGLPLAQIFAFSFLAPVEQSNKKDHKIGV
jgi:hypothetical protein